MLTEFIGNLACPLSVGHALVIVGKTIDAAIRFHISLRASKDLRSNIPLQLSCNFRQKEIIRNAFIDGEWSNEEIQDNLDENSVKNPILPGEFFMICILPTDTQFYISINNRPFCKYKYKLPLLNNIRTLEVGGNIQVIKQIDHRTIYPYSWPPLQTLNLENSFSNDTPILFTPGHVIVITACAYRNPHGEFVIKFYENDSKRELIHFNPRFESNVVVRNAMTKNLEFGVEERENGFPFRYNHEFKLAIAFGEKACLFAVNGKYFTHFVYRTNDCLQDLNGLKISTKHGMQINVTGIDHIHMPDPECHGFENYSSYV